MPRTQIRQFVGNVPAARAILRKAERHGIYVKKGSGTNRVQTPEKVKEALRAAISFNRNNPRGESYSRMLDIIAILEKYPKVPTAMHLAQAIAYERGLKRENLLPWLNSAASLQRKFKPSGVLFFEGVMRNICVAVSRDIPWKVEQFLFDKQRAFTTNELKQELGTGLTLTSESVNLLDAMGLVKKLPPRSEGFGGQPYVWVHSQNYKTAEGTIPSNFGLRLMNMLRDGPKRFAELGFPKSEAPDVTIAVDKLVKAGLLQVTMVKSGTVPTRSFSLTPEAERLLGEQGKMSYLHPELRVRLLGERNLGLKPHELRILQRVLRYIGVYRDYGSLKGVTSRGLGSGLREEIAKRHSISTRQVHDIMALQHFPLKNFSLNSIKTRYLPALRMIDADSAQWLENNVNKNPDKFRQATSGKWKRKRPLVLQPYSASMNPTVTLGEELRGKAAELFNAGEGDGQIARKTRLPLKAVRALRASRREQFIEEMRAGKYGGPKDVSAKREEKMELIRKPGGGAEKILEDIAKHMKERRVVEESDVNPELKRRLLERIDGKIAALNSRLSGSG